MLATGTAAARRSLSILGLLVFLAVVYAFFAGLRTVADPDLGWQVATGRWIVQHHEIPSTDVLSYTAAGKPWIYPALSQVILYWVHKVGGCALLSWLSALACVATILIIARHSAVSAILAIVAVPIIASRTDPRAELFTELLFAVFVSLLWKFHRTGRAPLWALPPLMLLWVNLHLGFVAGLGMCAAYVVLELVEGRYHSAGARTSERLRIAAPAIVATIIATLVNPWGPAIYTAIYRQGKILGIHRTWIAEWRSVRLSPLKIFNETINWRHPDSAIWWLFAIALVAMCIALWRRRFATAGLLAGTIYVALDSIRMKGPFATIVVVVAGSVLYDGLKTRSARLAWEWVEARVPRMIPAVTGLCLLTAFVSLRAYDLASNQFYAQVADRKLEFGPGEAPWYPEEAVTFITTEKLPGNLFNDYVLGGFVAWKLSPELYRDYIDGRSVPFSEQHFFRSLQLLLVPLDSIEWQKEADTLNIKTIFVSLNREAWGGLLSLPAFCASSNWRPVYLDAYAAVFVRKLPETTELIQRLGKNCDLVPFALVPPPTRIRTSARRFDYHLNSATVLMSLGRKEEAVPHLDAAEAIFPDNPYLHYQKGLALGFSDDLVGAEAELKRSLEQDPSTAAYALAKLWQNEGRWAEAEPFLRRQIKLSEEPSSLYLELGEGQLEDGRAADALQSFTEAENHTLFRAGAESVAPAFHARLNAGRARAWRKLGDLRRATESLKVALSFAPTDPDLLRSLAELKSGSGDTSTPSPVQMNTTSGTGNTRR